MVDQFEELFTQCADEGQRRAFITALHAAATAGHGPDQAPAALVVLGVRADFEARCADYPQLAGAGPGPLPGHRDDRAAAADGHHRTSQEGRLQRRRRPGRRCCWPRCAPGQPGASGAGVLPLLSHALDQAWRCRTGQALTLADYERTGGIEGAVAASAQRAYDAPHPGPAGRGPAGVHPADRHQHATAWTPPTVPPGPS